jgi:hypothetical protein
VTDESHLFPATYRATIKSQVKPLLSILGLALFGFFGRAHLSLSSPLWLWIFAFVLLGLLLFSVLNASMCRVTLYEDRIEKKTWFGKQTMRREDVALIRPGRFGGFSLTHRHNSAYGVVIPAGIERDAAWNAWLSSVPAANSRMAESPKNYLLLIFSGMAFVVCFVLFLIFWAVDVKEHAVAGYAHTKARIERAWTECSKGGCYKVGEISFQREQNGQTIACRATVGLRSHSLQDILEIAPEPDSCYRPTVLGSPTGEYKPWMIRFGVATLIALGLIFVGYRIAFGQRPT